MNKVICMGYLTRAFEVIDRNGTKVARSSMALNRGVDKDGNDRGADFPSIVAFGKKAEFLETYGKKGRRFLVEGHIQTGSYQKEDGTKVYTTDIIADRIEFADSMPSNDAPAPKKDDDFMYIPDDLADEIPFN